MSKEYIAKDELEQALIKEAAPLLHYYKRYLSISEVVSEAVNALIGIVQRFPAADVVEVAQCEKCVNSHSCQEDKTDECCDAHSAHWIKENDHCYDPNAYCSYAEYSCSYCGIWVDDRHGLPEYCPECGKKMKSPLPEPPMEETDNG